MGPDIISNWINTNQNYELKKGFEQKFGKDLDPLFIPDPVSLFSIKLRTKIYAYFPIKNYLESLDKTDDQEEVTKALQYFLLTKRNKSISVEKEKIKNLFENFETFSKENFDKYFEDRAEFLNKRNYKDLTFIGEEDKTKAIQNEEQKPLKNLKIESIPKKIKLQLQQSILQECPICISEFEPNDIQARPTKVLMNNVF